MRFRGWDHLRWRAVASPVHADQLDFALHVGDPVHSGPSWCSSWWIVCQTDSSGGAPALSTTW